VGHPSSEVPNGRDLGLRGGDILGELPEVQPAVRRSLETAEVQVEAVDVDDGFACHVRVSDYQLSGHTAQNAPPRKSKSRRPGGLRLLALPPKQQGVLVDNVPGGYVGGNCFVCTKEMRSCSRRNGFE